MSKLKHLLLIPVLAVLVLGVALALLTPGITQASPPPAPLHQPPVVQLLKVAPATAFPNQQFNYTFFVTNTGAVTAAGLVLTDTIPTGATFIDAPGATLVGNTVVFTLGGLAPGQAITPRTVAISATQGLIVNNNYILSGQGIRVVGAPVATAIGPNLGISKSGPASTIPGDPIRYTLSLTNTSNVTASNVVITDTVPVNANFVSATGGQLISNVVSFNIGGLNPGQSITRTFVVTAPQGQIINNDYHASATGGVSATGNPVATVVSNIQLRISKSGPASVGPGDPIRYILTVTSTGVATATNALITDTVPAGANFVSATGGQLNGNVVNFNIGNLGPGQSITRTFVVTATQGIIVNRNYAVSVSGGAINSGKPVSTTIQTPNSVLRISKRGPMVADARDNIRYTLSVTNASNVTATNVVITDVIPAGANYVSSVGGVRIGNVISFTIGTLGAGQAADPGPTFVVTATQTITNRDYRVSGFGNVLTSATGNPVVTVHGDEAASIGGAVPGPTRTLTLVNDAGLTVKVNLIRGAVTQQTGFILNDIAPAVPLTNGIGFFSLDAYQSSTHVPGLVFSTPITITIYYADSDVEGLDEESLTLYFFDEAGGTWQPVVEEPPAPCGRHTRFPAENKLQVNICHLTDFGVTGEEVTGGGTTFLPLILKNP